jgi:hypothetical protein
MGLMAGTENKPISADSLTPEQRQIVGLLQMRGKLVVSQLAAHANVSRHVMVERLEAVRDMGLVELQAKGVCVLTPAGEAFNNRQRAERLIEGEVDARLETWQSRIPVEQRAVREASRKLRKQERLLREPAVRNPDLNELPAEFVDEAANQARLLIQFGRFEALRDFAGTLERRWQIEQIERSPLAQQPLGARLATHLSDCRDEDGRRVSVRLVNSVEEVCSATLGAVKEHWPTGFQRVFGMGTENIKQLGRLLLAADLLTIQEYEDGVARFDAIYRRQQAIGRRGQPDYADFPAELSD